MVGFCSEGHILYTTYQPSILSELQSIITSTLKKIKNFQLE